MTNALTVDVEDYFQVSAFETTIARDDWEGIPLRVERNVDRLLQMFSDRQAKATFFTLGWIAERRPGLVSRIAAEGHEIASHGYGHLRASDQTPAQFREDISSAKKILEDLCGTRVCGYRAPSFSIGLSNLWAFEELEAAGHTYSSSVYPVVHDHYGMPDAPRFPYQAYGALKEVPITTVRKAGRNMPAGGGGYFRLAPYWLSRWAIREFNEQESAPAIFYMHPWEIDPLQPRVAVTSAKSRFRHYVNLDRTEPRLDRLLTDFSWGRMDDVFGLR